MEVKVISYAIYLSLALISLDLYKCCTQVCSELYINSGIKYRLSLPGLGHVHPVCIRTDLHGSWPRGLW